MSAELEFDIDDRKESTLVGASGLLQASLTDTQKNILQISLTDIQKNVLQVSLTDAQKNEFRKMVRRGIYKELHHRNLLTDAQLDQLISRIS